MLSPARRRRREYKEALSDGSWVRQFRGRDVLKRFVDRINARMKYEPFRDLVLARMRDDNYQPRGMGIVVEKILASKRDAHATKS